MLRWKMKLRERIRNRHQSHTETQDLQNPQEKDHQVLAAQEQDAQDSSLNSDQQNQDGQESDDGSQIQPVSEEQDQETGIETEVETQAEETSVSYRTHVQTYGWQDYVKDGETSGTWGSPSDWRASKSNWSIRNIREILSIEPMCRPMAGRIM